MAEGKADIEAARFVLAQLFLLVFTPGKLLIVYICCRNQFQALFVPEDSWTDAHDWTSEAVSVALKVRDTFWQGNSGRSTTLPI